MAKAIINGNEIFGNVHLGEGGGASAEAVLDNGQISTTSAYATASFNDISGYEYVLVRFRDTVSGTDYTNYSDSYYDIYADIVGFVSDVFDIL